MENLFTAKNVFRHLAFDVFYIKSSVLQQQQQQQQFITGDETI